MKKVKIVGYGIEGKFVRNFLFKKHKGRCFYCSVKLIQYISGAPEDFNTDHLTPISKGGDNEIENLVACCAKCNSKKQNKTLKEYVEWMKIKKIPFDPKLLQRMGGKLIFSKRGSSYMSKLAKRMHKLKNENANRK